MAALKHVHTYARWNKTNFRCIDPDCTSYSPKNFLVGKRALCNLCGKEFILTADDLRRSRPRCIDCSNTKFSKSKVRVLGMIEQLELSGAITIPEVAPPLIVTEDRYE